MKDLIQEGRKIQEAFKKNVTSKPSLNESAFYMLFKKLKPIAPEVFRFFEKTLSDLEYSQNLRPFLQMVVDELFKNSRLKELNKTLKDLKRQIFAYSDKDSIFPSQKPIRIKNDESIEKQIKEMSEELEKLLDETLDRVLDMPKMKPYFDKIKVDPDSFRGSRFGMSTFAPRKNMSDSEAKAHIKDLLKRAITFKNDVTYYGVKID